MATPWQVKNTGIKEIDDALAALRAAIKKASLTSKTRAEYDAQLAPFIATYNAAKAKYAEPSFPTGVMTPEQYDAMLAQQKVAANAKGAQPPTPAPVSPWAGQPYDTQWREWFKATYPNEDINTSNNIKAIRDYWEKNIMPQLVAADTGVNPNAVNPNEMTDYQKFLVEQAKLDRQRQDYKDQVDRDRQEAEARNKSWVLQNQLQSEASQSAIEKQRNELELIKGRAFPFGDEAGRSRAMQEIQVGAFESARQSILSSLTSPSDWIKRWEVQNAANPYTPQPQSRLEQKQSEVSNTETRVNMFTQMAGEAQKLVDTLSNDPAYEGSTVLAQAQSDVANYRQAAVAEGGKLPFYQADVTYLQGQPQPSPSGVAQRGNAPSPAWLPMFAPGQRAGQAITRENVATPSAQQWASTPWSVQQGLAGYTDWAGYRSMADILGNMAQMLPNSPGGGARWSPNIGR